MPFWKGSLGEQARVAEKTQNDIMSRAAPVERREEVRYEVRQNAQDAKQTVSQQAKDASDKAKDTAKDAGNKAKETAKDVTDKAKDTASRLADDLFEGQEIRSRERKTESGLPLPPEVNLVGRGKKVTLGPGAGIGFGCGAGIGAGVTGGLGFGIPSVSPGFQQSIGWVFGFGVGCGFGVGYGYGFGIGSKWEGKLKKPSSTFAQPAATLRRGR